MNEATADATADEEWRAIPGYDGYEASSLGRIRSLDRKGLFNGRHGRAERRYYGRILRLKLRDNGCGAVYQVCPVGSGKSVQVSRLVCLAFHGYPPTLKHEAAHLDGVTLDNRPGNLVWATPIENAAHKIGHGTSPVGGKNGAAKLSDGVIQGIFDDYLAGVPTQTIAFSLNVSRSLVTLIIRRVRWAHVPIAEQTIASAQRLSAANIVGARNAENAKRKAMASRQGRTMGHS